MIEKNVHIILRRSDIMSDTGGSIAIRGFNYQKISIIYTIIENFSKENFKIFPEAGDDFEVHLGKEKIFVQVKGSKGLTLGSLTKRKNNKNSILEKNLLPGDCTDKRKIFLWSINDTTKKDMLRKNGEIVQELFYFSRKQKKEIIKKLILNVDLTTRLNNQFIFITPFNNNINDATIFLKGVMLSANLISSDKMAMLIIEMLSFDIDSKSSIEYETEEDLKRKEINGTYLKKIFKNGQQKELHDTVLHNLKLNSIRKRNIKLELMKKELLFSSTYLEALEKLKPFDVNSFDDDTQAIEYIVKLLKVQKINFENDNQIYAVAINLFCEEEVQE